MSVILLAYVRTVAYAEGGKGGTPTDPLVYSVPIYLFILFLLCVRVIRYACMKMKNVLLFIEFSNFFRDIKFSFSGTSGPPPSRTKSLRTLMCSNNIIAPASSILSDRLQNRGEGIRRVGALHGARARAARAALPSSTDPPARWAPTWMVLH